MPLLRSRAFSVGWHALTDGHLFTHVLRHTGGNLSQAAKILGIHRTTLRARIEELGIRLDQSETPISADE